MGPGPGRREGGNGAPANAGVGNDGGVGERERRLCPEAGPAPVGSSLPRFTSTRFRGCQVPYLASKHIGVLFQLPRRNIKIKLG
jgi:hypothetical protein